MAHATKSSDLPSAVELFGKSYALVRKNLNVYALVYAIPAAMAIAGMIQMAANNDNTRSGWGHAFGSSFFGPSLGSDSSFHATSAILAAVLGVGAIISYFLAIVLNLRVAQGQRPTLGSVWGEVTQKWLWLKLIGLGILTLLILLVGFVLLIVPGVIFIWRLFFAPYVLVDKKVSVMDALSESWNMTKGHAWPIYSIVLFSIVLALSGIIPVVGSLASFALGVAYAAAPALRYQELKKTA